MTSPFEFLDLDDVLELHEASLARFGGSAGVRDPGALEAAVMQPQASFDGEYLYENIFAMAAAYAFHIAEAQALVDGNKRAGVLAAITFLDLNGIRIPEPEDAIFRAMIDIANRVMTKAQLESLFREIADV
jgi:death-on-curing protein